MLTLEQFRATKQFYPHGFPQMEVEGPAWIYDNCGYISVDKDGQPFLIIANLQWYDKPIEELEEILYTNHYIPEYGHAGS